MRTWYIVKCILCADKCIIHRCSLDKWDIAKQKMTMTTTTATTATTERINARASHRTSFDEVVQTKKVNNLKWFFSFFSVTLRPHFISFLFIYQTLQLYRIVPGKCKLRFLNRKQWKKKSRTAHTENNKQNLSSSIFFDFFAFTN